MIENGITVDGRWTRTKQATLVRITFGSHRACNELRGGPVMRFYPMGVYNRVVCVNAGDAKLGTGSRKIARVCRRE